MTRAEDGKQRAGVAFARAGDGGGLCMPESCVDLVPDDDSPPVLDNEDDAASIPIIPAHV